jgi:hypothetical protein
VTVTGYFMFRQVCLHTLRQFAAGEHDTMLAAFALQTNIRPETEHGPFIGPAWVRFPQAHMIVQLQIWKHGQDYTAMHPAFILSRLTDKKGHAGKE